MADHNEAQVFVEIDDYPGYLIGDHGDVISLDYRHTGKPSKLASSLDSCGYPTVHLYSGGDDTARCIHRAVGEAFIANPENKPEINHLDGNKENNHVDNLEWVTSAQNNSHAGESDLMAKGEDHPHAKLSEEQVLEIRRLYAETDATQYDLADRFGMSKAQIGSIVRGEKWSHV